MKMTIKQLKQLIKEQIEEGPWSHLDPDEMERFVNSAKPKSRLMEVENLLNELVDTCLGFHEGPGYESYEHEQVEILQNKILAMFENNTKSAYAKKLEKARYSGSGEDNAFVSKPGIGGK